MSGFLAFAQAWAKLVGEVFSQYPLAAAIVTLIAVALFLLFERTSASSGWPELTLRFFLALVAWAILVPILGTVLAILTWLGEKAEQTLSGLGQLVRFLYGDYVAQPIPVLILFSVSVIGFFVWNRWRPHLPVAWVKALLCAAAFILLVAVGVPIANQLGGHSTTPRSEINAKAKQTE
jgi:hypothetical protein